MKTKGKFDAYSYILQHKHINYCEAIIFPNGTIEDAQPSHVAKLIKISEIPESEIWNVIKVSDSPIVWLCNYTGCISVWYDFYITAKKPTKAQLRTLRDLYKNGVVSFEVKSEEELLNKS